MKSHRNVDDRRQNKFPPWMFVVFTDKFMSGWGGAQGGRSLYALAVESPQESDIVTANGKRRTDMKNPRLVKSLSDIRMGAHDHLAVVDKHEASRWYQKGGF